MTDPEARLGRKSQTAEAKLCCLGHGVTENRHGLLVNVRVTQAYGQAEREAALEMGREIPGGGKLVTLAADRGYDAKGFVEQLRESRVTLHVAKNTIGRRSAADGRDGAARRLRVEPGAEEAGGAGVWVDEDGGGDEESEAAGMRECGMDGDAGYGSIQSASDEEPDGGGCVRSGEKGQTAPRNGPTGQESGRRRGVGTVSHA